MQKPKQPLFISEQGEVRPIVTLRDQFAIKTMSELLNNKKIKSDYGLIYSLYNEHDEVIQDTYKNIAESSYKMADAMLKERDKDEN